MNQLLRAECRIPFLRARDSAIRSISVNCPSPSTAVRAASHFRQETQKLPARRRHRRDEFREDSILDTRQLLNDLPPFTGPTKEISEIEILDIKKRANIPDLVLAEAATKVRDLISSWQTSSGKQVARWDIYRSLYLTMSQHNQMKKPDTSIELFEMFSNAVPKLQSTPHLRNEYMRALLLIDEVERKTSGSIYTGSKGYEYYQSLVRDGLDTDYTTGYIVPGLVALGDLSAAESVVENREKAGKLVIKEAFTSLMAGYSRACNYDDVWRVYNQMLLRHSRGDQISYTLLMNVCTRQGEAEKALALFETMCQQGLMPTLCSFEILFRAFGTRKEFAERALAIYDRAATFSGLKPNEGMLTALMNCAAKAQDWLGAGRAIWNLCEANGLASSAAIQSAGINTIAAARTANPAQEIGKVDIPHQLQDIDALQKNLHEQQSAKHRGATMIPRFDAACLKLKILDAGDEEAWKYYCQLWRTVRDHNFFYLMMRQCLYECQNFDREDAEKAAVALEWRRRGAQVWENWKQWEQMHREEAMLKTEKITFEKRTNIHEDGKTEENSCEERDCRQSQDKIVKYKLYQLGISEVSVANMISDFANAIAVDVPRKALAIVAKEHGDRKNIFIVRRRYEKLEKTLALLHEDSLLQAWQNLVERHKPPTSALKTALGGRWARANVPYIKAAADSYTKEYDEK